MSEVCTTSQWIQFFRNAGLPPNVAANYAIIFSDNRIQLNMLMDLSKEYLYDMGIRVMGDVIAILRHAKDYHNQLLKEKMIGVPFPLKRSSPVATRILNHYTRPVSNKPKPSVSFQHSTPISSERPSAVWTASASKKRTSISLEQQNTSVGTEIPVKKIRKLSTGEEGAYRIKMPVGSTERSRKILQQQQAVKRSVFERLGDSDVSSSTDVKNNKNSSVFERLGPSPMGSEVSTSTPVINKMSDRITDNPLQYRGVLKGGAATKGNSFVTQKSGTVVRTTGPPLKSAPVKIMTSRPIVNRLQSNRTVLARGLATSGVVQVNQILKQNSVKSSVNPVLNRGIANRATVFRGTTHRSPVRASVTNRLGFEAPGILQVSAKGKVISLRSSTSRFAKNTQSSVFQRLGK